MNNVYVEVVLTAPPDDTVRELLSFQLHELGFTGFLESVTGFHCYIPKALWNDAVREKFVLIVKEKQPLPVAISAISEIENQNWNRQWEESILPVEVSKNIVITPSWHSLPGEKGKIVLVIDPKMSFGTGYHESTRLMLRMMERYITPNSLALDVGTGTGILAIAAVKLGSQRAIGIDIDEWSYDNANENVRRNECEQHVEIRAGSMDVVRETRFNFILANITRNVITELLPSMTEKIERTGTLLLSGLLASDRAIIEKLLRERSYGVLSIDEENEWIGIAARKK